MTINIGTPKADRLVACSLCSRGTPAGCVSPSVASEAAPLSFERARAPGGACGPEALRFEREGWSPAECSGALPETRHWSNFPHR